MKTGSWLEVIKRTLTKWFLSAKGARQLEPGATPQELDSTGSASAESAIQSLQRNSQSDSRFQR